MFRAVHVPVCMHSGLKHARLFVFYFEAFPDWKLQNKDHVLLWAQCELTFIILCIFSYIAYFCHHVLKSVFVIVFSHNLHQISTKFKLSGLVHNHPPRSSVWTKEWRIMSGSKLFGQRPTTDLLTLSAMAYFWLTSHGRGQIPLIS